MPFVTVEGEGVHEIPVGPVHAGTIEPGHFRFSVLGERVLRLEERLGYTHKGIEKRFEQMALQEGVRLAVAHQRRFDSGLRLGVFDGGRGCGGGDGSCARRLVARALSGARARRQSSGRSWLHRQRRRARVWTRTVLQAQGRLAAHQHGDVRPSLSDGRDHSGRHGSRSRSRTLVAHGTGNPGRRTGRRQTQGDLRRPFRTAGSLHQLRKGRHRNWPPGWG